MMITMPLKQKKEDFLCVEMGNEAEICKISWNVPVRAGVWKTQRNTKRADFWNISKKVQFSDHCFEVVTY